MITIKVCVIYEKKLRNQKPFQQADKEYDQIV